MAAVLACGPEAHLSHRSAAALWQILPTARFVVDVTAPGRTRQGRPGIQLHLVRNLDRCDRSIEDNIAVTSVARTLLDLAETVLPRHLERAIEQAERLQLLDLAAVEHLAARSHGRRGLRPLFAVLENYVEPAPTRSELERRFLELCRSAELPQPAVNSLIAGLEVDVVWHDQRLVVELDGHEFHGTREAFERDRVRDATLQLAGYRVLRVTHRRLLKAPNEILATVRLLTGQAR